MTYAANTSAPMPDSAREVPYSQATLEQKSQALQSAQQELKTHFPNLNWLSWAQLFDQLEPCLLVENGSVALVYEDSVRLTQVLMRKANRNLPFPIYCNRAHYLARKLDSLTGFAWLAMEELEADPLRCGPLAFELIIKLVADNGVVLEVLRALSGKNTAEHQRASMTLDDETGAFSLSERLQRLAQARKAALAATAK